MNQHSMWFGQEGTSRECHQPQLVGGSLYVDHSSNSVSAYDSQVLYCPLLWNSKVVGVA